jgi:hypothetical protein
MSMPTRRILGLSAAILLVAITAAEAKDLCINPYIRLSRFKQPPRGQCLPVAGTEYEIVPSSGAVGHYGRVTGTVCTRSDGTELYVALTQIFDPISETDHLFVRFNGINIQLPSMSYFSEERNFDFGNTVTTSGQAAYCSNIPIP